MKRLFILILLLMITTEVATAQTVKTKQEKQEIKIMITIKGQKIAFNIPMIRK